MKRRLIQSGWWLALICVFVSVPSKAASVEDTIDFRQSVMTLFKWYMAPMGAMTKGTIPFDSELFKNSAEGLANVTRVDVTQGFPEDSVGESAALPEIWFMWDEFTEKYQNLKREAAVLQQVASGGDEQAMKAQFVKTGKACGACHKKFRQKQE